MLQYYNLASLIAATLNYDHSFLRSRFHCKTLIHFAVNNMGVGYHHVGCDAIETEQGATPTERARISRKFGAYLWRYPIRATLSLYLTDSAISDETLDGVM